MITNAKDLEYYIQEGNFKTIYWDLDGCLANFNREYYIRTGMKAEDDPSKVWDIFIPWVEDGFFCTLWPIRPTVALVHRLEREGYDVQILTACGPKDSREYEDIQNQKAYWCNKYLKGIPLLFVEKGIDKAKRYAKGNAKNLLVDDQLSNVRAFIDEGGSGVYYTPDYGYLEEDPIAKESDMGGVKCDMAWIHYIEDERTW